MALVVPPTDIAKSTGGIDLTRPIRRTKLVAFLIVTVSLFVVLAWSLYAPLAVGAHAPGKLILDGTRKEIEHQFGGTVSSVLINEGDVVSAGDILLEFDRSEVEANLESLLDVYSVLVVRQALVNEYVFGERFQPESLPDEIRFRDGFVPLVLQQIEFFQKEISAKDARLALLGDEEEQLEIRINAQKTRISELGQQLEIILEEEEGLKFLLDRGLVQKPRVNRVQRDRIQIDSQRSAIQSEIASIRSQLLGLNNRATGIESEFLKTISTELREGALRTAQLKEQIAGVRRQLEKTRVVVPISGQVIDMQVRTAGAVVAPGERLMSVIPLGESVIAELEISPLKIDRVEVGANVDVMVLGLPRKTAPIIHGRLLSVSKDTIFNSDSRSEYYLGRVELPQEELARISHDIQPGMPIRSIILAGERTIFSYLVGPFTNLMFSAMTER